MFKSYTDGIEIYICKHCGGEYEEFEDMIACRENHIDFDETMMIIEDNQ